MFKFAISDFVKIINFAINKVKIVEIVFNKLFVYIITINKYNDIIFLTANKQRF